MKTLLTLMTLLAACCPESEHGIEITSSEKLPKQDEATDYLFNEIYLAYHWPVKDIQPTVYFTKSTDYTWNCDCVFVVEADTLAETDLVYQLGQCAWIEVHGQPDKHFSDEHFWEFMDHVQAVWEQRGY